MSLSTELSSQNYFYIFYYIVFIKLEITIIFCLWHFYFKNNDMANRNIQDTYNVTDLFDVIPISLSFHISTNLFLLFPKKFYNFLPMKWILVHVLFKEIGAILFLFLVHGAIMFLLMNSLT
jgi:hypothetical protein